MECCLLYFTYQGLKQASCSMVSSHQLPTKGTLLEAAVDCKHGCPLFVWHLHYDEPLGLRYDVGLAKAALHSMGPSDSLSFDSLFYFFLNQ